MPHLEELAEKPFLLRKLPLLKMSLFQAQVMAEGIGSFMLLLTITLAEANCGISAINGTTRTRNLAPMAIGFMLSVIVFTFAYISGGHFNPAVTLGALLVKGMRIELATSYWISQCIGGVLGALFALFVNGTTIRLPAPHVHKNLPQYVILAFIAEAVFTGILVTVVLHVAYSKQRNNGFYGLAVGLCVMSAAYAVGEVSGGSFNPAVAFSLQVVKCFTGNCIPLMHLWLYFAAPAAGALGASVLFKMTLPPPEETESLQMKERAEQTAAAQDLY